MNTSLRTWKPVGSGHLHGCITRHGSTNLAGARCKEAKALVGQKGLAISSNMPGNEEWLAHDGLWFQAIERRYGMEAAVDADTEAWRYFSVY